MDDTASHLELRDIAVDVVVETAERITRKRAQLGDVRAYATTKSSPVDPVTVVDTMAEDHISARLGEIRPRDGLIGEEGADRASLSGVSWVVDPIDGTVNFLYGIPQYAVSVAAARDGEIIAGAVVNVVSGEVFCAARGGGAFSFSVSQWRKGIAGECWTRLATSDAADPSQALVATGFSYLAHRRAQQARLLTRLLPEVRDIRRMGSAALDLCQVAAGRVDAYYEHGINCWDFAAGALIAGEAGAAVLTPPLSAPGAEGHVVKAVATPLVDAFDALWERLELPQAIPAR